MRSSNDMKCFNCIRISLNHLKEHEFSTVLEIFGTAICCCNTEIETSNHFLLCCKLNVIVRRKLHSTLHCICPKTFNMTDNDLVMLMLYSSNNHDGNIKRVLEATVRYIDESFNKPLL